MLETLEELRRQTARDRRRQFLREVPSEAAYKYRAPGSRLGRQQDHSLPGISKGWHREWRSEAPSSTDGHGPSQPPRALEGSATNGSPPFVLPSSLPDLTRELASSASSPNVATALLATLTPATSSSLAESAEAARRAQPSHEKLSPPPPYELDGLAHKPPPMSYQVTLRHAQSYPRLGGPHTVFHGLTKHAPTRTGLVFALRNGTGGRREGSGAFGW